MKRLRQPDEGRKEDNMGLAALMVGLLIAGVLVVSIAYGVILGLMRLGEFLWRLLVEEPEMAPTSGALATAPCWEAKGCPPAVREACPAYQQRQEDLPCWLTNMRTEGRLRVSCLTCSRFSVADLVAA